MNRIAQSVQHECINKTPIYSDCSGVEVEGKLRLTGVQSIKGGLLALVFFVFPLAIVLLSFN